MNNWSLKDYDQPTYGPLLGISDEGSAAEQISEASILCAKKVANKSLEPDACGLIYDAERMTSAGEVPVGPREFEEIVNGSGRKTLYSTNVGVRANARLYQPLPEFFIKDAISDEEGWLNKLQELYAPFVNMSRPLTIRMVITTSDYSPFDTVRQLNVKINALRDGGTLGAEELHRMTLLIDFDHEIVSNQNLNLIREAIDVANELNYSEVAIDGDKVEAARKRLSVQGVLNVLSPEDAASLLKYGKDRNVRLRYRYAVDIESIARTIWTGLYTSKAHGLHAAKYGLVPLQLEDQIAVMNKIQSWMPDWTAVPAFYVDTPMLTDKEVLLSDRCKDALINWIDHVKASGATVVLVDCPDRINPRIDSEGKQTTRRTIRLSGDPTNQEDRGVLTYEDIAEITNYSKSQGVNILWSGGIRPLNAFELGKMDVFGIFTTSSTAIRIPVGNVLASDWQLAAEVEPTTEGIQKVHSLLQAGFLYNKLRETNTELAEKIDQLAHTLIDKDRPFDAELESLKAILVEAWQYHWNN